MLNKVNFSATAINGDCPAEHDLYSCGDGFCYKAIGDYLDCSRSERKICPKQFPVNCGDKCYTKVITYITL